MSTPTSNDSSVETPWTLERLSETLGVYIDRLGSVWVEAEITQWGVSGGHVYGRMKDIDAEVTVDFTIWRSTRDSIPDGVGQGDRVIVKVKPNWYVRGGRLSMNVLEMRLAGLGELLAKIEALRATLTAEGLFALERKKPLPFLPGLVGLITAKDSDAEKDVLRNAQLRWPEVNFRVEHASVQGEKAVPEIIRALDTLEADSSVDVIIIARGGGDFQHLLVFSDEALVRRAAACAIPLVSAIGHEADRPLLDEVADLRASTPTDAAKRVVPDVGEERERISDGLARIRLRLDRFIAGELERLELFKNRPVLANPVTLVDQQAEDILRLVQRGVDRTDSLVERSILDIAKLRASTRALSPHATLERGYAIVHGPDGALVSDPAEVSAGDNLDVRVKGGSIPTTVRGKDS
jgi:exodeoxyribonuclease VII large subunit